MDGSRVTERLARERQIKLELIASIARSQQALARILESVADVAGHSGETARLLRENVDVLAGLQSSMAETVAGVKLKSGALRRGTPGEPWLHPVLRLKPHVRRGSGEVMKRAKKSARAKTAVKSARGKTKTSRRPAVRRPAAGTAIRPVGENGSAEYNAGYNEGFAEGFEAGHRKAYEEDGA